MILNIYRLVAPDKIDPGMVIDTDRGPLLVDEVRRTLDGVVASGHRLGGNGKRRAHIPLPAADQVAVLPDPEVEEAIWGHVVDAVRRAAMSWVTERNTGVADGDRVHPDMAPWATVRDSVVVRDVDGVKGDYWLEMPTVVDAEVIDDPEPV